MSNPKIKSTVNQRIRRSNFSFGIDGDDYGWAASL